MININNLLVALDNFSAGEPFKHCVVDDFLNYAVADEIQSEFMDYNNESWFCYKNALEDKKALNDWNQFPMRTYGLFCELISTSFVKLLSDKLGYDLKVDPGLHGGGWHVHGRGGNLNPHLDYSIHPRLKLQRKLNIIIYVSKEIQEDHGGHLGLWSHDARTNSPKKIIKTIWPKFNRAVLFDTTQNSWHGMCSRLELPEGIYRKSLAVYYLIDPPANTDPRERALFAPRDDQKHDKDVNALIEARADNKNFSSVYRLARES